LKEKTMKITINGQTKTLPAPLDIAALLEAEGYSAMKVAVARNGDFVSKSSYADITLDDGDSIEIVAPMQGG
jgi:thiamine biosynthesis protein ThiS